MPFAPTDIANCCLWLDAQAITGKNDGDALTAWADASGASHNAAEATNTPSYQTNELGGYPVVRFDGSNDHMHITDWAYGLDGMTVFALVKPTGSGAQMRILSHGDEGANTRVFVLGQEGATDMRASVSADGAAVNFKRYTKTMAEGKWQVLAFRFAPGVLTLASNGAIYTNPSKTTDGTVAAMYNSSLDLLLGACFYSTGVTYNWAGDVAELVMYDDALTDTQMQQVVTYLWQRWHVPASIYVATDGNDTTGTGAIGAPYATIVKAESVALPGDTIYLRTGTHTHNDQTFVYSGADAAPVTISGYAAETAVIDGGGTRPVYDTVGAWYRNFTNVTLEDSLAVGCAVELDAYVEGGILGGSHHWTFTNCIIPGNVKAYGSYFTMDGCTMDGSTLAPLGQAIRILDQCSHHPNISHCTIHDYLDGVSADESRGIWLSGTMHSATIHDNTVYNIGDVDDGMGIDTDGYTLCQYGHQIDNNECYACGESGIEVENTFDSIIEYNTIHDCGRKGIDPVQYSVATAYNGHGVEGDARGQNSGNTIRYNLIYDNTQYGFVFYDVGGTSVLHNTVAGCGYGAVDVNNTDALCPVGTVRDNIFAVTGDLPCVSFVSAAAGFQVLTLDDYNLLYNPAGIAYTEKGTATEKTLAQYVTATTNGDHSVASDPLFSDAAAHDYALLYGSPAVGTASDATNMGYEQTVPTATATGGGTSGLSGLSGLSGIF